MTTIDGLIPPVRNINFTLELLETAQDVRFYGDQGREMKEAINAIAQGVLDPDNGHVLVIGFGSTGKSFLIEQFAGNTDQYITHSQFKSLNLVKVSPIDAQTIQNTPNGLHFYLNACCEAFNCRVENICLVTESPDFAATVFATSKRIKTILELNMASFMHLNQREHQGLSKIWASWGIVDVNELNMNYNDLNTSLKTIMLPKFNHEKYETFVDDEIETLIEYFIDQIPELEKKRTVNGEEVAYSTVPPGLWGTVVRRLATSLAFNDNQNNDYIDLNSLIEAVFNEFETSFREFLRALDPDSPEVTVTMNLPGNGSITLPEHLIQLFKAQGEPEEVKTAVEPQPLIFSKITTLQKRIEVQILGQEEAVRAVVDGMTVPAAGLQDPNRPLRSFLFLGPTGVGKTQLALTLAEQLGETPLNVIRLDMSEYGQAHEAAKLLGAPSGYVGFENGGILTNQVKANPYSLIVLDEVEKAHGSIWDSFLQIFDAGRMTDNRGVTVDFTHVIIVMTSNLGGSQGAGGVPGFTPDSFKHGRGRVMGEVEKFFRPEFLNRIDELVFFNPLTRSVARKIIEREVNIVANRVELQGSSLNDVDEPVIDAILGLSQVEKYGARDIQRMVVKQISQPLARHMLSKEGKTTTMTLSIDDSNGIKITSDPKDNQ